MNSIESFHRALASEADLEFANFAVDWFDRVDRVWRPTVIEGRCPQDVPGYSFVEIAVPLPGADDERATYGVKRVAITELRPTQLLNDRIGRYFTTRYALSVMDDLREYIDATSSGERLQLRAVVADLRRVHSSSFESWLTAFNAGSPDGDDIENISPYVGNEDKDLLNACSQRRESLFSAMEKISPGQLHCAPVGWWDEFERRWRATLLMDATGSNEQFSASQDVRVLVPGTPADLMFVSGADIRPISIKEAGFSLCALPVVTRDLMRLYAASEAAGLTASLLFAQPILLGLARMVRGAADEWAGNHAKGFDGEPPTPQVAPLPASLWGFTEDEAHSTR